MTALQARWVEGGAELSSNAPHVFPLTNDGAARGGWDSGIPEDLLLLQGIWADEKAEQIAPGRWFIAWDAVRSLEKPEARILGLPVAEDLDAELSASGIPTSSRFALHLTVRHPRHGSLDLSTRDGAAIKLPHGEIVLLSEALLTLGRLIDERPDDSAETDDRLLYLASCKAAAEQAGVRLDSFLSAQNIQTGGPIGVNPTEGPGGTIDLKPVLENHPDNDLLHGNRKPRTTYKTVDSQGRSVRVVIPPDTRRKAEAIGRVGRLEGPSVPELLTNPEAYLPEGVDLSLFSKRVQGFRIRVYNSRPYLHIRKEPAGWFEYTAGVKIDDTGVTGTDDGAGSGSGAHIDPKQYEDLARRASKAGTRWVQHGDDWIEIDPATATRFGEAHRKLESQREPNGRIRAAVVLDVISNLETLGFEVECPDLDQRQRPWMETLPDVVPPSTFRGELDSHQTLGFRWLSYLANLGIGGLLADDMGVGKTAQVIAHLCALAARNELRPSLIVMPKTLVENWVREFAKFAPQLRDIVIHEGPSRPRSTKYLADHDIVITSYDSVRQDQVGLGVIDWQVVALDEAQYIKNPTAGRTSAVKALKCKQLIAMTGTPVENGLVEFWSIMDRVRHGMLGGWADFRREFERPLIEADENRRDHLINELMEKLDPHYLRRLKSEVLLDLPPKEITQGPIVELGPLQRHLYEEALEEMREGGRGAALVAIGKLLRICSHPRVAIGEWDQVDAHHLTSECPKLDSTIELIGQIRAANEKVVVFAEWKATQRILQRAIVHRYDCWPEIINGDVTDRRQLLVDAFRSQPGFNAIILSPKVAGLGLNIVEANHVIHYTRPWNPAVENQATDRVHRRGQTRVVHVHYPTVAGGVEEALARLLQGKEALARDVLRSSSERTVSAEEIFDAIS